MYVCTRKTDDVFQEFEMRVLCKFIEYLGCEISGVFFRYLRVFKNFKKTKKILADVEKGFTFAPRKTRREYVDVLYVFID